MALTGWGGLLVLVLTTYPVLWARWAFFFCLTLAVTGSVIPPLAQAYRRFAARPVGERTVLRQALLVGVYVGWLAWLQLGRLLTGLTAALLFVLLGLFEGFAWLRERSHVR